MRDHNPADLNTLFQRYAAIHERLRAHRIIDLAPLSPLRLPSESTEAEWSEWENLRHERDWIEDWVVQVLRTGSGSLQQWPQ